MNFAEQLKRAMIKQGFNQVGLARAIGKGKSSISQYLSGKNLPNEDTLNVLEEILDCHFDLEESINADEPLKISISLCSKMLGKSEPFIRTALREGNTPFGFATKTSDKWDYHISPYLLKKYVGEETYYKFIKKG